MTTARRPPVSSKRARESLPDSRDQRVGLAHVLLVLRTELLEQHCVLGLHPPIAENRTDNKRHERGHRSAVNERPCQRYQKCSRIHWMTQIAVDAALDQHRILGASARRKKSELHPRPEREPHPEQFEQHAE